MSAARELAVRVQRVSAVDIERTAAEILIGAGEEFGKQLQLSAAASPSTAQNTALKWRSSDESVATVDQNGQVTSVGEGEAQIAAFATDGSEARGVCAVRVAVLRVTDVAISTNEAQIVIAAGESFGKQLRLSAQALPPQARERTLRWLSSDESVAVVAQDGTISAAAPGECEITVQACDGSGCEASCRLSVSTVAVSSLSLPQSEKYIYIGADEDLGKKYLITPTLIPENAFDSSLSWSSSDESVARVEPDGTVITVSEGSADITAVCRSAPDKSAVCHIVVRFIKLYEINFSHRDEVIEIAENEKFGKTLRLQPSIEPLDAHDRGVSYASSEPAVAAVAADGTVTALSEGTAVVSAVANDGSGIRASCRVTVKTLKIDRVELSAHRLNMTTGSSRQLYVQIEPKNPHDRTLRWYSEDPEIVAVSADGAVRALREGRARVAAEANDVAHKHGFCTITVSKG